MTTGQMVESWMSTVDCKSAVHQLSTSVRAAEPAAPGTVPAQYLLWVS